MEQARREIALEQARRPASAKPRKKVKPAKLSQTHDDGFMPKKARKQVVTSTLTSFSKKTSLGARRKSGKRKAPKKATPEMNQMIGQLEEIVAEARLKFQTVGRVDTRKQNPDEVRQLEATKAKYEQMLQDTMQQMVSRLRKEQKRKSIAEKNRLKA